MNKVPSQQHPFCVIITLLVGRQHISQASFSQLEQC